MYLVLQYFTMRHTELLYVLALLKAEGIGNVIARKLLSHFENPSDIFSAKAKDLAQIHGIGNFRISALKNKSLLKQAEKELVYMQETAVTPLFISDEAFPNRLRQCSDAPVLLFTSGKMDLNAQKVISIVGTRRMTNYGSGFLKEFIQELVLYNPLIVSGFAYGVDIAAHQFAVQNNLQTVGVLAHGLADIYPKVHKKFIRPISENGGLVTEFFSDVAPDKEHFVRRNRIVAGLADATIVVESADRGGSLITANFAFDYSRDVFAVPGRLNDKFSAGCNHLIKCQKAALLTSVADLVYLLNWEQKKNAPAVQKQLFVELKPDEQTLYDTLYKTGKLQLDDLAIHCDLPVHKTAVLLLELELKGLVLPLPGKFFEAI